MHLRAASGLVLAALLAAAAVSARSQTVPAASEGGGSLAVGGGPASYDVDWGHGRMLGGAVWIDFYPRFVPPILRGIGIEAEARDISIGASLTQPNLRQDTAGGGLIYNWRHFANFYPYGKALMSFGSYGFRTGIPTYSHDTRTLLAYGGGLEYRLHRHIWVRADYEYQFWQRLINKRPDPQGFTAGAMYDFRAFHRR